LWEVAAVWHDREVLARPAATPAIDRDDGDAAFFSEVANW